MTTTIPAALEAEAEDRRAIRRAARQDRDRLQRLREFLDREHAGGASHVRIDRVRALIGADR